MAYRIDLSLSPKQASDAKYYTPIVARELRVKESDIALLRIVKRSVDARRGALKVNLSLEAYIDKEEQPAPLHFDYPSVVGKPEVIIRGAGPAGLYTALRLIELGLKPIIFERGKEVVERGKDIAKIQRNQGVNPDSNYALHEARSAVTTTELCNALFFMEHRPKYCTRLTPISARIGFHEL